MRTCYLVGWITQSTDLSGGPALAVSSAGFYSDPHPTCALNRQIPVVLFETAGVNYADALEDGRRGLEWRADNSPEGSIWRAVAKLVSAQSGPRAGRTR